MLVLVQNLQKKAGLAGKLAAAHDVDVLLAQEANKSSEARGFYAASYTSRMGYGTAVYARDSSSVRNEVHVLSPVAELGGFIRKKTTVVDCGPVQFVSFHGYNGTPGRNLAHLAAHVSAVLAVLHDGPTVFAGDFNTWTQAHLDAVSDILTPAGFVHSFQWPYPGRDFPLDHVFVRQVTIESSSVVKSEADHRGALLRLSLSPTSQ
jgi:endonuclease/exonuclease/phosphatase (EEP) superfamily protein YafD